ncbi:MAG: glycosyltransferase family 2 protein [Candidatus Sumerlaeia bacterium]|nr:glycosyltransferase family 2 protein [Candidatus Sumerlaeia bacterium]
MAARPLTFSIVIVSLNGRERLAMPLDALRRCDPPADEVIVVDNGSSDGTSDFVREHYPEVLLVRAPHNLGFAGGNNLGLLNASGDVLVLLNDDTEPETDWLAPLHAAFHDDPRLGIAGVRLLYPDRQTIQHLGGTIEPNGLTKHLDYGATLDEQKVHEPLDADYVTGAALAIRRQTVREIGLLDAGFWPIYFEEVDWCERARRRHWHVRVYPASTVIHHESQTTVKMSRRFLTMYNRNRLRFLLKHRRGRALLRAVRAEARWLAGHRPWDNFWPLALAYAWAVLQWREIEDVRRREGLA